MLDTYSPGALEAMYLAGLDDWTGWDRVGLPYGAPGPELFGALVGAGVEGTWDGIERARGIFAGLQAGRGPVV